MKYQSIKEMNNNGDQSPRNQKDEHNDFYRGSLACRQATPRCGDSHLEVHVLIGITHQTLNRVLHHQHKMRITQAMSNLLEYLLALRWGKVKNPSITMIGAGDNHQPSLDDPRCSKPSRWWQPPRVTSESRSETQTPSASRCNHSGNALGFTPNLTKMMTL